MKANNVIFVILIITLILTSCNKPEEAAGPHNLPLIVNSIQIAPDSIHVAQGQSHQFTAEIIGTTTGVNWIITDNLINTTNINASGLLTIANNETAERLTVTVTSKADESKSDTAIVTVPPIITGVVVSPVTVTLSIGGTQQFNALVSGSNSLPKDVLWSVAGGATGTNIDENGLLTIAQNETATTLTVTAKSVADSSKSVNATVNIPQVTSVTVTPSPVSVGLGQTQQFTAVVSGTNNPPQTVTWSISSTSAGISIDSSGLLTVANNETVAYLLVYATSTYDTTKYGNATVLIPTVTHVVVNPSTATVARGSTQQFTATVNGTNNPPQTVNWSVTGGTTATTINTSTGLLIVANGETNTTLTVRATSAYDGTKSGTATVTVLIPTVTSVVVAPSTATVARGGTQQFTATVNGTNTPPQTVYWTVTTAAGGSPVSTINNSGLLTVPNNETNTTLIVRATSTYNATISGTATVMVTSPLGISVIVSPSTVTIAKCQAQIFTATVHDTNNPNPSQTVMWTVTGGISTTTIGVSSGLLEVAYNETATTLTVRATSVADFTKYGDATVTVAPIATGPAGGYIFYDKGSYSDGWRYLESAPASSEFTAPWGLYGIACPGTSEGIGTGQANTAAIIALLLANLEPGKAAMLCAAMTAGGYSDWFLPSKDELNLMYVRLRQGSNIGGFNTSGSWPGGYYWSSSVGGTSSTALMYYTWYQRFSDGTRPPLLQSRLRGECSWRSGFLVNYLSI